MGSSTRGEMNKSPAEGKLKLIERAQSRLIKTDPCKLVAVKVPCIERIVGKAS